MINKILLTFIFVCFSAAMFAETEPRFLNGRKVMFGHLPVANRRAVAVFTVLNNTGKPLQIVDVKTSCGCTTVSFPRRPIPANTKTKIYLTLDTKFFRGYFMKTAMVCFYKHKPQLLRMTGYKLFIK